MRFIFSIFGGFKNLIATVAQILLAILVLPALSVILKLLMPEGAVAFLWNLLQEVPFMDVWLGIVTDFSASASQTILPASYLEMVLSPVRNAMAEACVIGMCIYMCKTVGTMIYIRGVPVLQTVFGVFLGCIVLRAMQGDMTYSIMAIGFMVIANIVLTILAASGQVLQKVLGIFLGLGLQSVIAGLAAAYVAALTLILRGYVSSFFVAVGLVGGTSLPLLIVLLLDYFLLTPKKRV